MKKETQDSAKLDKMIISIFRETQTNAMHFVYSPQHKQDETEQVRVVVAQEEPQAPLPGSLPHPPASHVRAPVQGAAPEVQRALHAHPSRWRGSGDPRPLQG